MLEDPTRFYLKLDKNALESISIGNKILQDSTGYLTRAMESISIANKILQDPTRSYKILHDRRRFYVILDENAKESISIAKKILQDPTRSLKILRDTTQNCFRIHINSEKDPTRMYGILDKNAMESLSIAKISYKILQDPTRPYKILRDTRQKCY